MLPNVGTTRLPPLIFKSQRLFIPDASNFPAILNKPEEIVIDPPLQSKSSFAALPTFNVPFETVIPPYKVIPAPQFIVRFAEFSQRPVLLGREAAAVKGVTFTAFAVEIFKVPDIKSRKFVAADKLLALISNMLEAVVPKLTFMRFRLVVAPVPLMVWFPSFENAKSTRLFASDLKLMVPLLIMFPSAETVWVAFELVSVVKAAKVLTVILLFTVNVLAVLPVNCNALAEPCPIIKLLH